MLIERPVLAGTCASAAILTRPNLAPLAAWLALGPFLLRSGAGVSVAGSGKSLSAPDRGTPGRRVVRFLAATAPGVVAWLALNQWWYGRALASGYGSVGELFSFAAVTTNAARYADWIFHTQTPFILLGVTSPWLVWMAARRASLGRVHVSSNAGVDRPDAPPAPGPPRAQAFSLVFAGLLSGSSVLGRLDWPPAVELVYATRVRFYDPRDRARYLAGEHLATIRVRPGQRS